MLDKGLLIYSKSAKTTENQNNTGPNKVQQLTGFSLEDPRPVGSGAAGMGNCSPKEDSETAGSSVPKWGRGRTEAGRRGPNRIPEGRAPDLRRGW